MVSCKQIDATFGPYAGDCRGGFDFTLLFEESILSILPLGLLLIIVPFRVSYLFRRTIKVDPSSWLASKLVGSPIQHHISSCTERGSIPETYLRRYSMQSLERCSSLLLRCGQNRQLSRPRHR